MHNRFGSAAARFVGVLAVITSCFAAHGVAVPGLYQRFCSGQLNTTEQPTDTDTLMPGAYLASVSGGSCTYDGVTYKLGGSQTCAWKGVMRMSGGVTYTFRSGYDDCVYIKITDPTSGTATEVVKATDCKTHDGATYVPAADGWYGIDLRIGNNSGGVGPLSGRSYSLAWTTNGTYRTFMNTDSDVFLYTEAPSDLAILPIPVQTAGMGPCEPSVIVSNRLTHAVLASSDYDVAYADNAGVGRAKVTVTGKGAHAGQTTEAYFYIGGVIRVAPDGTDSGSGTSWATATTWSGAVSRVSFAPCEIWVKGDVTVASLGASPVRYASLMVRGGFDGSEATAADRTDGARASVAAVSKCDTLLPFSAGANNLTLTLDHMCFKSAYNRAVLATRASGITALSAFVVTARDCEFVGNGGGGRDQPGHGLYAIGASSAAVTNCLFAGNRYLKQDSSSGTAYENAGNGCALAFSGCAAATLDDSTFVTNGVKLNTTLSGCMGHFKGSALYVNATPIAVRGCRFAGNVGGVRSENSSLYDGGTVCLEGACGGSSFRNCAFVGNMEMLSQSATYTERGGALVILLDSKSAKVALENCTFAYNLTQGKNSPGGLNVVKGDVTAKNVIFYENVRGYNDATQSTGWDADVKQDGKLTLRYSLVTAGTKRIAGYDPSLVDSDATVVSFDPSFVTPLSEVETHIVTASGYRHYDTGHADALAAFDVHLLSPAGYCVNGGATGPATATASSAIDAGDPASAYANEPAPNGGRVNLGSYGNTREASKTSVGQPSVTMAEVTCPDGIARPVVTLALGIASGVAYNATVTLVCKTGTVTVAEKTFSGVQANDTLTYRLPYYFADGVRVDVTYTVTALGATTLSDTFSGTVSGTRPDFFGHGGGANVVHVRTGADCLCDGTSWEHAYPDLLTALAALTDAKTEIWIASDSERGAGTLSRTAALAIRGGFTGVEDTPAERTASRRTKIDNNNEFEGLSIASDVSVTADGLEFWRSKKRALVKTGKGDLTVKNCGFYANGGYGRDVAGRGIAMSGSSAATLVVTNCTFAGNCFRNAGGEAGTAYENAGNGCGVSVGSCVRAIFDDCVFVTNGVKMTTPQACCMGNHKGFALYASATPVTARRCRFAGNVGGVRSQSTACDGGTVCLEGACGGSAFTNCAFVGNMEMISQSTTYTQNGGALAIILGNAAHKVDIQNCTFAYNLSCGKKCPGGLNVVKGDVTVGNSIFYNNVRGYNDGSIVAGYDIDVKDAGSATVRYSSLTSRDEGSTSAVGVNLDLDSSVVGLEPAFVTPLATVTNLIVKSGGWQYYRTDCYAALAAFDVHLLSAAGYSVNGGAEGPCTPTISPAIDAGDPSSAYANEPEPNGKRINLGAFGNTDEASKTSVGQPTVESASVTCPDGYARAAVTVVLGSVGPVGYSATVRIVCMTGGVKVLEKEFPGQHSGDVVVARVPHHFREGTVVTASYTVIAPSAEVVAGNCSGTVSGLYPAFVGKGGGAHVIHVRPGADCLCDGTDWEQACPDVLSALGLLTDAKTEIWIATGTYNAYGDPIVRTAPLAVRGGFAGTENSASERPVNSRSTLDNFNNFNGLTIASGEPVVLDRIDFRRATKRALVKTGAGDLTVTDCGFYGNGGAGYKCEGHGISMSGASVATLTLSNCVFAGNCYRKYDDESGAGSAYEWAGNGGGVAAMSCVHAYVDDCTFVTNGVTLMGPEGAYAGNFRGAALYAAATPLTVRRCRFAGNVGAVRSINGGVDGGTVVLAGACGGSAFTNCAFVGNTELLSQNNSATLYGGAVVVDLANAADRVDFARCTFAYNIAQGRYSPGGLNVVKGAVTAQDMLFFENLRGVDDGSVACGGDVMVRGDSTLTLRHAGITAWDELRAATEGSLVTNTAVRTMDPLFVSTTNDFRALLAAGAHRYFKTTASAGLALLNVHLRSHRGYFDEQTGEHVFDRHQAETSPALDAGDKTSSYALEPSIRGWAGNGRRVNLGCYGNTPYATMTPIRGAFLRVR